MLIPNANHPDEERLSALASGEADATADAALTGHVSTCDRCTELVNDLGALRASLAELPDLRPSRPLRLLPPVADEPARVDRLGGWARRLFAPVLTAGAALALVGVVGTTAPAIYQAQSGSAGQPGAAELFQVTEQPAGGGDAAAPAAEPSDDVDTFAGPAASGEALGDSTERGIAAQASPSDRLAEEPATEDFADEDANSALTQLPAERSPWPMVLFTGITLIVAAFLLRWILVPRAD